jgi:hypothetical protein
MAVANDALGAVFGPGAISVPADGIPTVSVPLTELREAVRRVRGELNHSRFVDLTAVDRLTRE